MYQWSSWSRAMVKAEFFVMAAVGACGDVAVGERVEGVTVSSRSGARFVEEMVDRREWAKRMHETGEYTISGLGRAVLGVASDGVPHHEPNEPMENPVSALPLRTLRSSDTMFVSRTTITRTLPGAPRRSASARRLGVFSGLAHISTDEMEVAGWEQVV